MPAPSPARAATPRPHVPPDAPAPRGPAGAAPAWPPPSRLERALVGPLVRATLFRRRHGQAWAVPSHLRHEAVRFRGNGGADVAARWFPHPEARGVVVLAHPDRRYAQHWFVREGWVDWLHGHGFAALTFDFANYGGTRGGSTYLFEDCMAAVGAAHARAGGLPVHAVGLSIGAFSLANASPELDVDALVLESPYPSFSSWYEGDGHRLGRATMATFERVFPRTSALIRADERIRHACARRILVAASVQDEVTPVALTRRVAQAAPPGRSTYLELPEGGHLSFFRGSAAYRDAVLAALDPRTAPATPARQAAAASAPATAGPRPHAPVAPAW